MTPICAMMPRYGATSAGQDEVLRRRPDLAQQRRPQHDAGHHLADHARLAEVDEQLSHPAAEQQDRNEREQHVIQRAELVRRRGVRSPSAS